MSEILSRGYIDSVRVAMTTWDDEPDTESVSMVLLVNARSAARRLLGHIDATDDDVERIKADRDALRDELEALRPTVTIPGPHHVVTSRMTATPLGDLVADVDKRTRRAVSRITASIDDLDAVVRQHQTRLDDLDAVVRQHQTRLDAIGKNI